MSKGAWRRAVSDMAERYTAFLRAGVKCACGQMHMQPALLHARSSTGGGTADAGDGVIDLLDDDAPAGKGAGGKRSSAASSAAVVMDLTGDDDDDDANAAA